MAPPVFKTGLAANIVAGGFDSLPPPPFPGTPKLLGVFFSTVCQRRIRRSMSAIHAPLRPLLELLELKVSSDQ